MPTQHGPKVITKLIRIFVLFFSRTVICNYVLYYF
uniref:Uncharacterized protein n=1 Tax=Rhizophora mucronata TaxID=61149 RepID=A0A2P2KTA4_RHIMU